MQPQFHYTIFIARPVLDVWEALTSKTIIDRYYLAPVLALELKTGGRISYGAGDSELIFGIITEIDPPKSLVHSFRFAGSSDPETTVTYSMEPVGKLMSVLHITHSGFSAAEKTYADISGGWPVIASSLKTLLETGTPLPWPKH